MIPYSLVSSSCSESFNLSRNNREEYHFSASYKVRSQFCGKARLPRNAWLYWYVVSNAKYRTYLWQHIDFDKTRNCAVFAFLENPRRENQVQLMRTGSIPTYLPTKISIAVLTRNAVTIIVFIARNLKFATACSTSSGDEIIFTNYGLFVLLHSFCGRMLPRSWFDGEPTLLQTLEHYYETRMKTVQRFAVSSWTHIITSRCHCLSSKGIKQSHWEQKVCSKCPKILLELSTISRRILNSYSSMLLRTMHKV